jgi:hypothetical protein
MNKNEVRDSEIRAAFEARSEGAPSADLAERISAASRRTRQRRSLGWMPDVAARNGPRLLWAAVISAISLGMLGVLLVGGRQDDRLSIAPSPSPSASPAVSAAPSATAVPSESPAKTPHQAAFSVDVFVEVTGTIPIRAQPGPDSVTLDPHTFRPDVPLLVVEGPVSNDDVDWYYLVPAFASADSRGGWAPATDGGNPVLVPASVDCPASPMTSAQLIAIREYAVLGCFGSREITVSGPVSCAAAAASPGENAPSWTRVDRRCVFNAEESGDPYSIFGDPVFDLVPADAANGVAVDGYYELTGHFDDERCQASGVVIDETRLPILICRASFIVTDIGPTGIAVDSAVRTVADNLRVRSAPGVGVSSATVGPLLPTGSKLFVIAGPVAADGYDWYHILPFDNGYAGGWIASADRDGSPWLESDTQACPTSPLDAAALASLVPYGGLACYGSNEMQLVGDVMCEVGDLYDSISGPDWLRTDRHCEFDLGVGTMAILDGGIPGLVLPTTGRMLVTGHFDDPQAASCVDAILESPAPDPAWVVVGCRTMFVATDIEAAP